jgi:hypothetical protein
MTLNINTYHMIPKYHQPIHLPTMPTPPRHLSKSKPKFIHFLAGPHKLSPFKVKTPNQTYLVGALEDGNVGSKGNEGEVTIRC